MLLINPRYNIINPTFKKGIGYLKSNNFEILFYIGGAGDLSYFYKIIINLLNLTKQLKKKNYNKDYNWATIKK